MFFAQKTPHLQSFGFHFLSYTEDVISWIRQSLTVIYCAMSGRETSSLAACGLQLGTWGE